MSDLIERDKVLDQLCLNHKDVIYIDKNECAKRIKAIPSARPKGEWKEVPIDDWKGITIVPWYRCTVCGVKSMIVSPYCPNCGADMRKESE